MLKYQGRDHPVPCTTDTEKNTHHKSGLKGKEFESQAKGDVLPLSDWRVFQPQSSGMITKQVLMSREHVNGMRRLKYAWMMSENNIFEAINE